MPDVFVAEKKEKKPQPVESKKDEIEKKPPVAVKIMRRNLPRFLSSFIIGPKNLRFEAQDREEKIVLLLRRHPLTLIPWLLLVMLMIVAPLFVPQIFALSFIPANFLMICYLTWYLIVFALAFERFLTWFFNVGILTDERIVDINFPSLLYRDISEVKTDKTQQVSTKTGGYIRSLFNFGDVLIQSAGEIPEIYFDAVPNPEQVSKIINELLFEEEQEKLEGRIR